MIKKKRSIAVARTLTPGKGCFLESAKPTRPTSLAKARVASFVKRYKTPAKLAWGEGLGM